MAKRKKNDNILEEPNKKRRRLNDISLKYYWFMLYIKYLHRSVNKEEKQRFSKYKYTILKNIPSVNNNKSIIPKIIKCYIGYITSISKNRTGKCTLDPDDLKTSVNGMIKNGDSLLC